MATVRNLGVKETVLRDLSEVQLNAMRRQDDSRVIIRFLRGSRFEVMIIIEWLWRQIVIAKSLSSKKFSSSRLSPRFLYPLIFIRGNGVFLNG